LQQLLDVVSQLRFWPGFVATLGHALDAHDARASARSQGPTYTIQLFEHVLAATQPSRRRRRGLYVTPPYIAASLVSTIHHQLQHRFDLPLGLADTRSWDHLPAAIAARRPAHTASQTTFVQILDPATGTGAFPVALIEHIHATLRAHWRAQRLDDATQHTRWCDHVRTHLLHQLIGFEVMFAPHLVAHLHVGLALARTGYVMRAEDRLQIHWCDALTMPAHQRLETLPQTEGSGSAAHPTVVLGNPPFANTGRQNRSAWILDALEVYKTGLSERKTNLHDDAIKFIRLAHHTIEASGAGVVGLVTPRTYLDGITHRRMRAALLESFDTFQICDLQGDTAQPNVGTHIDENLFDIRQRIAISVMTRALQPKHDVRHTTLTGDRATKQRALTHEPAWHDVAERLEQPDAPYFFLSPRTLDPAPAYRSSPTLRQLFVVSGCGIKTERDAFTLHLTHDALRNTLKDLCELDDDALRSRYTLRPDSRDWSIRRARDDVRAHGQETHVCRVLYKPFDLRHTWYSGRTRGFIGTPGRRVAQHLFAGDNVALISTRQQSQPGVWQLISASKHAVEGTALSNKTREALNYVFPLYRHTTRGLESNLAVPWLEAARRVLKAPALSPQTLFFYIFALLHSHRYRTRFATWLRIDFPRIPLPREVELVEKLAVIGQALVDCYTLDAYPPSSLPVPARVEVGQPRFIGQDHAMGTLMINPKVGWPGVSSTAWQTRIGAYPVLQRWLRARKGQHLERNALHHLGQTILALDQLTILRQRVDQCLASRGDWRDAFAEEGWVKKQPM